MVGDEPLTESTAVEEDASTPRVLIVDDEEAVLMTLRGVLELDRYDITATASLIEAFDLVGAEFFDVVLADLQMGDGEGADLLKALHDQGVDTAVIVLTGYASVESVITALRDGAYDYLLKPCDVVDLRATVARGVERGRLAARLRQRMDDLQQANETIRALNLELEARVEQATAELREQIAAKDEFMSTVSHDLKSPLTFIKGMANLRRRRLVTTPENQPVVEALEQIESAAGRMAEQLDESVDASRLALGRPLVLRRELVDLIDLVRKAVSQHQQTTDRHVLYTTTALDELVGSWDGPRLRRVIDTLLDNAAQYSPRGGTVEVRVNSEPGQAMLSVYDRGAGIPAVELSHIFEPFERGRNVEGWIRGTGIGLAGARSIIELHEGSIAVESAVGVGTTFTIRLPLEAPLTQL